MLRLLFLRGPIFRWWVCRKWRRLEASYLSRLVPLSRGSDSSPELKSFTSIPSEGKLRSILVIADCLWEKNELLPELEKIAKTELLDLHPPLAASFSKDPAETVAGAVEAHAKTGAGGDPDLILFYARSTLLSEEVFQRLRRRWKCPLVGMNLDDKTEYFSYRIFADGKDGYQQWAKHFDLNLSSSVLAAEWYRKSNLPVLYCPMGYHQRPQFAQPPSSSNYKFPFSFVGARRMEREGLIAALEKAGISVSLFGKGWESQWVPDPAEIYRQSQMNLGMGFVTATGRVTNIKARDFECPGTGGCYMTTYNWELPGFYELGKEILCYRSVEELVELYTYYVQRPEECLRIARRGHARCAAEHTWEKRFREVFRSIGFKT